MLRATVLTREENVRLLQRRFDLGDIGELVLAVRRPLSTARTDAIGAGTESRAQLERALAVLLGGASASFSLSPGVRAVRGGTRQRPLRPCTSSQSCC